jgi:hypothetical protein
MVRKVKRFTGNPSLAGAGLTRSGWLLRHLPLPCPIPRLPMGRIARAHGDRADAHVTVVDLPGLLRGITIAAAVESGHALLKRRLRVLANGPLFGCCDRGEGAGDG